MSYSVYTSCALNYLPKARALAASLARHAPKARLTLILCDTVPDWLDLSAEPFHRIWTPESLGFDRPWIFEHNVMELCTAVKGRALTRLIEEEPEASLHIYLDPDVYLFSPLDQVEAYLDGASIGLVPHILAPEETEIGVRLTEMSVTEHGIYNLGHLFVRPDRNGRAFADWWAARLDRHCFDDKERGLFTDQRWVDLAPAIFDGVRIMKEPNFDVASWNLAGRQIAQSGPGDSFTVDGWPLITYHFSGTGPTGTHRRVREIFDPSNGAVAEIERIYEDAIAAEGQADLADWTPGHDAFDDGTPVTAAARKLYRRHADLRRAFPDPYVTEGDALTFQRWLRENRPGAIAGLALRPEGMDRAFDELFDADWYAAAYADVAAGVATGRFESALDHYTRIGSRLHYDPNEFFVSAHYAEEARWHEGHQLRRAAGEREGTLLWHYLAIGLPNGIEPIEFFDSRWYLERNPDLMTAFRIGTISTPLAHFLWHGSAEGRDPGPDFAGQRYLDATPRAQRLVGDGGVRGPFGALVRLGGVAGRVHIA